MDPVHPGAAIGRLSEKHMQVLALVAQHRAFKEVAWELGIAEDTVAQRMKRAQAILGVRSRAEAARVYLEAQQTGVVSVPPVYGLTGMVPQDTVHDEEASPGKGARTGDKTETLHQPQAAYSTGLIAWPNERPWYAWLLEVGRTNDLTPTARTLIIGVTTLLVILSIAAAVALAEGLSRII